jgi:hypothetical protein
MNTLTRMSSHIDVMTPSEVRDVSQPTISSAYFNIIKSYLIHGDI